MYRKPYPDFCGNRFYVTSPEVTSSFINRMTMWWFNDICRIGVEKPLEPSDLYSLNDDDSSGVVPRWTKLWERKMREYNQRCAQMAAHNADRPRNEPSQADTTPPLADADDQDVFECSRRLLRSLAVLQSSTTQISHSLYGKSGETCVGRDYTCFDYSGYQKTCLTAAVYRKILRLSNAARWSKTVGEIVNLMSIDINRFQQISPQTMQYWSNPLQIGLALFFLWHRIRISVLSGVAVIMMLFPINFPITMLIQKCQILQMWYKDERTKMVNEVLNGIKVIKLYAWEPMEKVIIELREKELSLIRRAALLRTLSDMFNSASPFLVALSTFSTFIILDHNNVLTPEIAFVCF